MIKEQNYGEYVEDYPITINLIIVKQIFDPSESDPLLYECYEIDQSKSELIKKYVDFNFDFGLFDYYLEVHSI